MRTIAFDSKEYHFEGKNHFYAPIGIGIETNHPDLFNQTYYEVLQRAFAKFGIGRRRKALSLSTLSDLSGDDAEKISNYLIENVSGQISRVWFFHTQVDSKKTPQLYDKGKTRSAPPLKYIRDHQQAYPYWCAWRLSRETDISDSTILLDAFQGEETEAWKELKEYNLRIFHKGDEVNALISTADILLGHIDRALRSQRLNEQCITRELEKRGFNHKTLFIGQPHYRNITSISMHQIDFRKHLPKPIIFVLHDTPPNGIDLKGWEKMRFLSPLMDAPLNRAFDEGVGCKGFDYSQDHLLMDSKDIFYYYGRKGEELKERISTLYQIPKENIHKLD
jgi:hypothetical protein